MPNDIPAGTRSPTWAEDQARGAQLRAEARANEEEIAKIINESIWAAEAKKRAAPQSDSKDSVQGNVFNPEGLLQQKWDIYDRLKAEGGNPPEPTTPRPDHRPAGTTTTDAWWNLIGKPRPAGEPAPTAYIDPWSLGGKYNPLKPATNNNVTMPLQQQYTEQQKPLVSAGFQYPKPTVQGSVFKPPTIDNGVFQQGNYQNPITPPVGPQGYSGKGYDLEGHGYSLGNDMLFAPGQSPSIQPPVGVPQGNSQPKIELPDAFKLNQQIAGPNIMQPLSIHGGINMPSVTPGVKPPSFPSMNWSDLMTVAHSR